MIPTLTSAGHRVYPAVPPLFAELRRMAPIQKNTRQQGTTVQEDDRISKLARMTNSDGSPENVKTAQQEDSRVPHPPPSSTSTGPMSWRQTDRIHSAKPHSDRGVPKERAHHDALSASLDSQQLGQAFGRMSLGVDVGSSQQQQPMKQPGRHSGNWRMPRLQSSENTNVESGLNPEATTFSQGPGLG